jgi:multicomponent K+:H+ antiporter subunit G
MLIEIVVSFFLLLGAGFALIGSIGLARLPDFFTRLHGPTKATTLGVGGMLAASITWFSARAESLSLHELLVLIFLFITAPVGAHLMAKAALHLRVRSLVEVPEPFARTSREPVDGDTPDRVPTPRD